MHFYSITLSARVDDDRLVGRIVKVTEEMVSGMDFAIAPSVRSLGLPLSCLKVGLIRLEILPVTKQVGEGSSDQLKVHLAVRRKPLQSITLAEA